jgi:hypothetical protein
VLFLICLNEFFNDESKFLSNNFFLIFNKAMGFVMAMFMNAMDYKEFDYAKNSMM